MQNPFDKTGKSDEAILKKWQDRLSKARSKYQPELDLMVEREEIYRGTHKIDKVHGKTQKTHCGGSPKWLEAQSLQGTLLYGRSMPLHSL